MSVKTNLNSNNNNTTISNENKTANESVLIIHQTPRASVLKIDSFVPNLKLQRLRKNSTKNPSLLSSSAYVKRLHHATTRNSIVDRTSTTAYKYRQNRNIISGIEISNKKNCDKNNGRNIYEYVRHQKLSSSSSSRIKSTITSFEQRFHHSNNQAKINSQNLKSSINLPLEYSLITNFGGICKILRTQKEKEKLPDRINCDKRGLTSIPLFLNENNLRLLSLQHNLINIFHVPSDDNYTNNNNNKIENSYSNYNNSSNNKLNDCNNDLPFISKITKHNIYFDKFDLKIDTTHQNVTTKKCTNNKVILNDEFEKELVVFDDNRNESNIKQLKKNHPLRICSTNDSEQHNSMLNCKQNYSAAARSSIIKNTKSKNLITSHTKQIKIFNNEFKASKNNNINITSFEANELPSSSTPQDSKGKLENNSSNIENIFKDKVLLNSSYANIYQNLIFLDLYNNQIEKILNLDGFKSLTVLLLGKNRIMDISGISSLKKTLRVLDLHGNKITNISNKINDLHELKSLNLAGNQIEQIHQNDFAGLINLKELNLKRNRIKRVYGFDHLLNLERLWLCHNELQKVDDMSSIAKATNLQEVTVENNPVSTVGDCVSFLVSYLPNLKILSQMPVTDQVRKAAMIWRKNKEISDRNNSLHLPTNYNNIRREEVISNARTNWELLRSQRTMSANKKLKANYQRCNEILNTTIEGYIESGMKQFHTSTNNCNAGDNKIRTPIINSEANKPLYNSIISENYCTKEIDYCEELQLPPITDSAYSAITEKNSKPDIIKSSSNSSLGPNLHSSSSGLGSDSEENNTNTTQIKKSSMQNNTSQISSTSSSSSSSPATSSPDLVSNNNNNNNDNKIANTQMEDLEILNSNNINDEQNIWSMHDDLEKVSNLNLIKESKPAVLIQSNENENDENDNEKNEKDNENLTTNRSDSELHTPKSVSTITSKIVNCSTKGDSSSSNSVLAINKYTTNNVPNNGLLDKAQSKQNTTCATVLCNVNIIKKCNKSQYLKSQTARINKNNNLINSNPFNVNPHQNSPDQNMNFDKSNNNNNNNGNNNNGNAINLTKQNIEREREQGGDYLIEICGKYLNVYGIGALRFIDKQWNQTKASDVNTLNFSYINFNNIATLLHRIKQRFPNAEKYIFRETNLQNLGQLNALADLQGIQSLFIDSEGNQILINSLWRNYAIFRLNHWGLKVLNNTDIAQTEIDIANKEFSILSDIVLWVVPDTILQPIIHKLHLDEKYITNNTLSPKEWLLKADKSIKDIVGKEALQWKKYNLQLIQSEERCFRERAKTHFGIMIDNLCNAAEKLQIFDIIWPTILLDIISNTLVDYSQMEVYLKKF